MNWTVTYVFGTAQDLLLGDCELSMAMYPFLVFPSQVLHCVMSFECNIAEQQMNCGQKEPDQWWVPESACGWHWLKQRVRACSAVATLSHLVTQEGCLKTKAPRTFVPSTVASTILPARHAKNPDTQHCSETIPNYSCKTPWL